MHLQRHVGRLLMGTAALHTLIGLILFWQILWAIVSAGVLNSIDPHYDRGMVFWFLLFGALLGLIGHTVQWMQARQSELPPALGWGLLALGIVGAALMPVSGFWLVIPQAYLLLRWPASEPHGAVS